MAATVGDYVVVSDNVKTMRIGGDIDETYSFSLPANLNRDARAVATWQFEADDDPDGLKWKLEINGSAIASYSHSSDRFCALQEVFAGSVLNVGANSARVTVLGGGGQIKFSDFVIHFQVNV